MVVAGIFDEESFTMNRKQSLVHRSLIAGFIAGAFSLIAGAAIAGECPADKRVADGQGQKMVSHGAKGVKDVVRNAVDLSKEPAVALKDRLFRIRQLDIEPGGIVPWHSHDERPAQIYIVSGEVIEYASNCAVPIVHKAGDISSEKKGTSHWWENKTGTPVVLISVDIFHDKTGADKKMM
jgi:quercetin dioxygenase-like cupin family protein